jgi:hypothetical protein
LVVLVGGFCVSAYAQGITPPMQTLAQPASLWEKWLSPDVVIGGILVLLYAGELRGDMRRVKLQIKALEDFQDGIEDRFMGRRELEARLSAFGIDKRHGPH